ncbi:MAG: hypothetical protein ACRDBH_04755 [Bosea sp. (in: a-proteobacteria)]
MFSIRSMASVLLAAAFVGGCQSVAYVPGTPEYAAAQVSRGYDCGLRVERARVASKLRADERPIFRQAGAQAAVRSYNAPQACSAWERAAVQGELNRLAR